VLFLFISNVTDDLSGPRVLLTLGFGNVLSVIALRFLLILDATVKASAGNPKHKLLLLVIDAATLRVYLYSAFGSLRTLGLLHEILLTTRTVLEVLTCAACKRAILRTFVPCPGLTVYCR
jgi:hypothetical protein